MASFQSILVGYYDDKKSIFCGKVRQGVTPASRSSLLKVMQTLFTDKCPFANLLTSKKSHFGEGVIAADMEKLCWVRPKLVAQVNFTGWTSYGLLRHATFVALREDKSAREVVKES